jgi:hypothetical protein
MSRDEDRAESRTGHQRSKDGAPKLVLEHDERPEEAQPESLAEVATSSQDDHESSRGRSVHQRRRRRRAQKLLVATILTGIFITVVMWSRGVGRQPTQTPVISIAPHVLFEQACAAIRDGQGDTLHITEYPVDDEMVSAMAGLDSLETVIFDEGSVSDQAITTIAKLPKLQHLRLRLSPISDEGMKQIAGIESLWYLNLPHAECTAKGVGQLSAIPRLRQLRLGSSNLSNEVTREIAKIESLRGLHLIGIAVTDEGLKTLAAMKHLESLYLDDSAVTEAGWEWLFDQYPHLHVHVDQSHHDRDPKAHKHH